MIKKTLHTSMQFHAKLLNFLVTNHLDRIQLIFHIRIADPSFDAVEPIVGADVKNNLMF